MTTEIVRPGERVGFIGLGVMGRPMARNLLRAGIPLVVHSRSFQAVEELRHEGAEVALTPADVAERCLTVITMLPDGPEVKEVIVGSHGVLSAVRETTLIIDMSTIGPDVARELAKVAQQRGAGMLDAPVSGGDVGARDATLSIMVGGDHANFIRALPLLSILGRTITWLGPSGSGQIVKACNQIVVAITIEAVSEALVLGSKSGVDPELILQVLSGGLAGSKLIEVRGRNFLEHNFVPGFRVALHRKDLRIAMEAARQNGVELPLTPIVGELLDTLVASGRGDDDHSALLTVIEDRAGHHIGNHPPQA